MGKRFLTYPMLVQRGIFNNRNTLRRAMQKYGFPPPYKLGERRVVWAEDEVETWLVGRKAARPTNRIGLPVSGAQMAETLHQGL